MRGLLGSMHSCDFPDNGGMVRLDGVSADGLPLELEVIVDQEEGLAWGLWWAGGDQLLAVWSVSAENKENRYVQDVRIVK